MKKSLLLSAMLGVAAFPVLAQKITGDYLTWPEAGELSNYVKQWNGGKGSITVNSKTWEDEAFFISRVKPRQRFVDRMTQVYSTINDNNDKRCIYWVPIGDAPSGQFNSNGFPAGTMDGETFSMWSYVDHYGDWTSPWGWVPGVFADVAHKNGVAVSGVAQPAFGTISAGWQTAFQNMANSNVAADAVGKFLLYHGVDGLGYNSEWTGYAPTELIALHNNLKTYMADKNPLWEVIWYAGTTDSGSRNFDAGVGSGGGNTKLFAGASMFLNYNWNNTSTMANSISYAKSVNRNPFHIYAGMNMQGGEPKTGDNYPLLKDYQYSIGLWGAHNFNMFWQSRNSSGSNPVTMQRTYINTCENFFGNAPRNPAIRKEIKTNRGHQARSDWAGFSSMMSARSNLKWAIADEPFITYFNLGNGAFFNWRGERVSDNEWYNIGIQDYLPTWRWWFADDILKGNVNESDVHLTADFVWDDAYMGGSCIQIAGSTTEEYLHLFKTDFTVAQGQTVKVMYKVLEGEGDVSLMLGSFNSTKNNEADAKYKALCTAKNSAEKIDASYDEGWQTYSGSITSGDAQLFERDHIKYIGLRVKNAKNLKFLLGGFELTTKNYAPAAPAMPVVNSSKVLENNFNGINGKLFWQMNGHGKTTGEPVYNADVNTSLFKVYAKEEGGEPKFVGATTSWAAFVFKAPAVDPSKKIMFGVSAVGLDYKAESDIAWGNAMAKGTYAASDEIVLSKTTIKPNESFTISYVDPNHSVSNWALYNPSGKKVASATSSMELEVPSGLPTVAGYDLKVDEGTANERVLPYFVQISSEEVGAMPEIYSISLNGDDVSDADGVSVTFSDEHQFAYTGRDADGSASRALRLNEQYIGTSVGDLKLNAQQSFSIAGWFRFDKFPDKQFNFFNVSNKAGKWPNNTWGWCWNFVTPEGEITCTFRGADSGDTKGELHYLFPNTVLKPEAWTHIAYVCEYATQGFRLQLYINGVKQDCTWHQHVKGNDGAEKYNSTTNGEFCPGQTYGIASTDDIYFGGAKYQGAAVDGIVDDFQIWTKAMTQEDVLNSMAGLDPKNLPAGLACLWDFESAPSSNNTFPSVGERPNVPGYSFDFIGSESEGAAVKGINSPTFDSGCPFLTGTAFPIETKAKWTASSRKTEITKNAVTAANEGVAGSAKVKFDKEGEHTITLTLENAWGSDSREYPLLTVKDLSAIDAVGADNNGNVNAYTVDKTLFLEFAQEGQYKVDVYNAAGQLVASRNRATTAGQLARIDLPTAGIYVVRIADANGGVRTIKVANN